MKLWGDLGHSETGSGETVGRVLKKKKKKKKAASFDFRLKPADTDTNTTTTATKRVVGTGRRGDRDSESETVEVETPHTPHTVTQVCTTPPSTQFTFIDVPMFTVHTSTGAEFQTVKSRTRKRATRAAHILAAGERAGQSRPTTAVSNNYYFATLDPAAISASSSGDSEPDVPPTAAQRPRRPTPPPPAPIQPAGEHQCA